MGSSASLNHPPRAGKADGSYRQPRTVDELTAQNVQAIHRLESAAYKPRSWLDTVAKRISKFAGSSPFLWMHVVWFSAWIAYNLWPGVPHFDPFPFTFLTLVVSLEAIFMSTFILISQNQAAMVSERRNQLDLQINLLTEQENTKALNLLERIARKLDVDDSGDPSLQVLEQATRPEKLAQQIEKVSKREE